MSDERYHQFKNYLRYGRDTKPSPTLQDIAVFRDEVVFLRAQIQVTKHLVARIDLTYHHRMVSLILIGVIGQWFATWGVGFQVPWRE